MRTVVAAQAGGDADSGLDLFVYGFRPEPGPSPVPVPAQIGRLDVLVAFDPDGTEPAEGVNVSLLFDEGSLQLSLGLTDAGGHLADGVVDLPKGTYTILAELTPALTVTAEAAVSAGVDNEVGIALPGRAGLTATVLVDQHDGSQLAAPGAARVLDGTDLGVTDENGTFSGWIPDGNHILDARAADGLTGQATFSVDLGEVTDVTVVMQA